jgi:3-oxoacyl-[acyl-carrier protein] reductase
MGDTKRVAVVAGGASGIGEATCRALAEYGYSVVVLDVDEQRARGVASEIEGAVSVICDVSLSDDVNQAFGRIAKDLGRIDVLVNSAGAPAEETLDALTTRGKQVQAEAAGDDRPDLDVTSRMTDAQWRRELAIYLDGTFFTMRAALRSMIPARSGCIVNVSSIHGISGGTGLPHYSAAKAGVHGLTRSVAKEVAPYGIRINAVAPGYIDTPATERFMPPALRPELERTTPAGRFGTAAEVAATITFLCSDGAAFMTGQTLSPNGGYLTV